MQLPLQITIRDFPHSEVLENHIAKKAEKLNQFCQRIMSCRVVVEVPQKHQHQGKLFNVRIDLTVPHNEFAVTRNNDQDVYIALREAFDDARRKLKEYSGTNGRNSHYPKLPLSGVIARIFKNEGYGFIETLDGHEVYFHHSVVKPKSFFKHLMDGLPVTFLEEMGEKGPQASRVRLRESSE